VSDLPGLHYEKSKRVLNLRVLTLHLVDIDSDFSVSGRAV